MTSWPYVSLGAAILTLGGCAAPATQWGSTSAKGESAEERHEQAMLYLVQAKVFEQQDNPFGAIVALRSAVDIDPSSPTLFAQLAGNYDRIQDYQQALVFAERAIELDPELTDLRFRMIRWYEAGGNVMAAAGQLEALIERQPERWQLYSRLARIYLETDQNERIDRLFDELLEREDTPADIKVNISYILSRSGRPERAAEVFEEVVRSDPENEDAWIGLAEIRLSRGDREGGINYYAEAARRLPASNLVMHELARLMVTTEDLDRFRTWDDAAFLYRLGVALSESEKFDLAAAVFERIVSMSPSNVDGWLDPARYWLHVEDYERADEVLGDAVAAMPDSLALYLFWGQALEAQERFDAAIEVYQEGLEQRPDDVDLLVNWGFAYEQQERYDEAIKVYRDGLASGAEPSEMYIRWGIVLGRQERWQEAIGRYRHAVDAAADDSARSTAYLHWGIALEKLQRWDDAIDKLTQSTRLDSTDTYNLFYLGSCLEQAARARWDFGDQSGTAQDYFDLAVETFKRLLTTSPDDAYALNYLGYMYAERGVHLAEAVELLTRAVAIDPANGAFFDSLGWAYFRLGDFQQAEHFLAKALAQLQEHEDEEQAIIYDHAGEIAHALGKGVEANKHWRKAFDLAPGNTELRRKLHEFLPAGGR